MKKLLATALALVFMAKLVIAAPVLFTSQWKTLEFFRIPATQYQMNGADVDITAKQSSSVIYNPLPKADWPATKASWDWETLKSVPPTNLAEKGGDDRNISIYFVFLDRKTAKKIGRTASIRALLTNRNARMLVYTFGGDKPDNTFLPNPYLGPRGVIIIKRQAVTGAYSENVDLAADYMQAFNVKPEALVGVALASDSDNTDKVVVARVSNLDLE